MKIKRYLLSTFCLCLFTACDSDDNLLCYGTHTEIEGDVTTCLLYTSDAADE